MLAWSHHLLLTSPGQRVLHVWVMRVSGSPGRPVPFGDQFVPCRTRALAQCSQAEGLLQDHLRGGAPHK